ncbi:MAG TPA: hypothetical protein VFM59_01485, partial [Salinimicrobium sp.]|nr:hypothetical protein [Salinimicrobium sp.]
DKCVEAIAIDTLGYVSIKDSLFGDESYKNMAKVPIEGVDAEFELEAGTITKNDNKIPVFEAKVAKEVILHDQDPDHVMQEKQVVSVDQVNGAYITVGSMEEVNTNGNWPNTYGDGGAE